MSSNEIAGLRDERWLGLNLGCLVSPAQWKGRNHALHGQTLETQMRHEWGQIAEAPTTDWPLTSARRIQALVSQIPGA